MIHSEINEEGNIHNCWSFPSFRFTESIRMTDQYDHGFSQFPRTIQYGCTSVALHQSKLDADNIEFHEKSNDNNFTSE